MRRSLIGALPAKLREELDAKLIANNFGKYAELAQWLKRQGHPIGKSSVHRYGEKLEHKLQVWQAPVTAAQRIDSALKTETTRIEQAKIRQTTGVLVLVIDPATRHTTLYATAHNPERTRELIELALIENTQVKR